MSERRVIVGDSAEVLRTFADNTFDFSYGDPPYGLGNREPTVEDIIGYLQGGDLNHGGDFMGKEWEIPRVGLWRELYRVMKPGAFLFASAGSRTDDLISLGIRAAGFERCDGIRHFFSQMTWVQGQGFPKSLNVSKGIDEAAGQERRVVGRVGSATPQTVDRGALDYGGATGKAKNGLKDGYAVTEAASDLAEKWSGFGTALKPAQEPILVFQKPIAPVPCAEIHERTGWDWWHDTTAIRKPKDRLKLYKASGLRIDPTLDVEWRVQTRKALHAGVESDRRLQRKDRRKRRGEANEWVTVGRFGAQPFKPWEVKNIVANVIRWGTGGLNIDATRVAHASADDLEASQAKNPGRDDLAESTCYNAGRPQQQVNASGRWTPNVWFSHAEGCCAVGERRVKASPPTPSGFDRYNAANAEQGYRPSDYRKGAPPPPADRRDADGLETVTEWECVDGCSVKMLDEQSGITSTTGARSDRSRNATVAGTTWGTDNHRSTEYAGDTGTASRFFPQFEPDPLPLFYAAKASSRERTAGGRVTSKHPTRKPLALLRHLIKLGLPPNGKMIDCFAGECSSGIAAALEGVDWTGVEMDPAFAATGEKLVRIAETKPEAFTEAKAAVKRKAAPPAPTLVVVFSGEPEAPKKKQLALF